MKEYEIPLMVGGLFVRNLNARSETDYRHCYSFSLRMNIAIKTAAFVFSFIYRTSLFIAHFLILLE